MAAESLIGECTQQTERVIDTNSVTGKMIAIVHFSEPVQTLVIRETILISHYMYFRIKAVNQFFFGDPAQARVFVVQRNIYQLIQVREN